MFANVPALLPGANSIGVTLLCLLLDVDVDAIRRADLDVGLVKEESSKDNFIVTIG